MEMLSTTTAEVHAATSAILRIYCMQLGLRKIPVSLLLENTAVYTFRGLQNCGCAPGPYQWRGCQVKSYIQNVRRR